MRNLTKVEVDQLAKKSRRRLHSALTHFDASLNGLPDDQPVTVFDNANEVEYELATSDGDTLKIGDLRDILAILRTL